MLAGHPSGTTKPDPLPSILSEFLLPKGSGIRAVDGVGSGVGGRLSLRHTHINLHINFKWL